MNATMIDDRRRLVLPPEFKPKSAVTMQMIDDETVLVKIAKPSRHRMVMLLPDVEHFPPDAEMDALEKKIAKRPRQFAPFEA